MTDSLPFTPGCVQQHPSMHHHHHNRQHLYMYLKKQTEPNKHGEWRVTRAVFFYCASTTNSHHVVIVRALQGFPSNTTSNNKPESAVLPCFFPLTNGSYRSSSSALHAMCFLQCHHSHHQTDADRKTIKTRRLPLLVDDPHAFLVNACTRCTLKQPGTCWLLFLPKPRTKRSTESCHHSSRLGPIWNCIGHQPPIDGTHRPGNNHILSSWTTTKARGEASRHKQEV